MASFQSGTRHSGQGLVNHLLRSQRAARLFLELLIRNCRLQWVVIQA